MRVALKILYFVCINGLKLTKYISRFNLNYKANYHISTNATNEELDRSKKKSFRQIWKDLLNSIRTLAYIR